MLAVAMMPLALWLVLLFGIVALDIYVKLSDTAFVNINTREIEMTLSMRQIETLQLVKERHIKGICHRWVWKFTDGYRAHTSQVRALEKAGLVSILYFSGSEAAVNLTSKGREIA